MELSQDNFYNAEQIFNKSLLSVPSVQLWKVYLDYVRRRNNLSTDSTGQARNVISQAYDFVLSKVGIDQDSGHIWNDYLQFVRSAPGTVGGSSWQDQQKMDLLRKAYQRAICVPNQMVTMMWKEYNAFEIGLNKITVCPPKNNHKRILLISGEIGSKSASGQISSVHVCSVLLQSFAKYHPGPKSHNLT